MRKILVAVTLVVATLAATAPADAAPTRKQVAQQVTKERVRGPLYGRYKGKHNLNWNKNGCSIPKAVKNHPVVGGAAKAYGNFFRASCDRHDFGYRNRKVHGYSRLTVDQRFLSNMIYQCDKENAPGPDVFCDDIAKLFYNAVRIGGGSHW